MVGSFCFAAVYKYCVLYNLLIDRVLCLVMFLWHCYWHWAVKNKYRGNPGKFAAWESASHVEREPKTPGTPPVS